MTLWLVVLLGCTSGDFAGGDRTPEGPTPDCPSDADCGDRTCGPDPICGTDCGVCDGGLSCSDLGQCCQPSTCEDLGATCGLVPDGCGGTLDCGTCQGTETCGETMPNHCGCALAEPEGTALVRIPSVDVRFHILLDGAELDPSNTTETDRGTFFFEWLTGDLGGGFDSVALAPWDGLKQAPTGAFTLPLVPGQYRLWYRREGEDPSSPWPRNQRARLVEFVAEEGADVVVDVPVHRVHTQLLVDGLDRTDVATSLREAPVQLAGSEGDHAPLLPAGPEGASVLPGPYTLEYRHMPEQWSPVLGLPLADSQAIDELVVFEPEHSIVADVASESLRLDLRLDGSTIDAELLPESIGARLLVQPEGSMRPVDLGLIRSEGTGTIKLPVDVPVLSGGWTVRLNRSPWTGVAEPWPAQGLTLASALAPGAETHVLDIETATITLVVHLDGEPISSLNTGPEDVGDLMVGGLGRETLRLPPLWDEVSQAPGPPLAIRLGKGPIDFSYDGGGRTSQVRWPRSDLPTTIVGGYAVEADQSVIIDIPTLEWSLDVRYAGAPLPGWPETAGEPPHLLLQRGTSAPGGPPQPATMTAHLQLPLDVGYHTVRVVPGPWTVRYDPAGTTADPFPNAASVLRWEQEITGDQSTQISLDAAPYHIRFMVGDVVAGEADFTDIDHPALDLTRPEPRANVHMLRGFHQGEGAPVRRLWTPGGFWFIHYYPGWRFQAPAAIPVTHVSRWPVAAALKLGCVHSPGPE